MAHPARLDELGGSMTPREIILANLDHQSPERPGFDYTGGRLNDFTGSGLSGSDIYRHRRWVEGEVEYYDDEWGNIWRRMVNGSTGGEVFKPALDDWRKLDGLRMPDFDNPKRFEEMAAHFAQPTDRFKMAWLPGWVFASSRYLRKMEIYFMDLIEYREEIDCLHAKVTGLLERTIRLIGQAGAEGVIFCEDLGVQDRVLIGPDMWRDVFKPHYLRLTGAAHECGMKVFMHSCGYNWALIDDLVDSGIDCFQFDQPAAYDMPRLAEKFKERKVALYSPLDIQKILPTGRKDFIVTEARRMVDIFRGFLIVKDYPDLKAIGVRPEWDQLAYTTFLEASGLKP